MGFGLGWGLGLVFGMLSYTGFGMGGYGINKCLHKLELAWTHTSNHKLTLTLTLTPTPTLTLP